MDALKFFALSILLVASLLSPPLLDRLVEVTDGIGAELIRTSSSDELGAVLRERTVHIAVVDPHGGEEDIARFLACYPSTLIIAYTELTKSAVQAIVYLAEHGLHEVVLHPYDDSYGRFSVKLSRAYSYRSHCPPPA
jgi:hypothetical protein